MLLGAPSSKAERSQWSRLMSRTKKDRNIQYKSGKEFPDEDMKTPLGSSRFATIIADALQREFGGTNAAVKIVVGFTHANERAVKNWFSAKNGPGGPHLVALMRHSEEVLDTLLILAGRQHLLTLKKISDVRLKVQQMLELLDEIQM
jgi:hypothetical protein